MKANNLYPIFIKLDQIETLIVGGGNVGLEKIEFILRQSPEAKIKVVSKEFHPKLIVLAIKHQNIKIVERAFHENDLEGIKLLILATNNTSLNKLIRTKALQKNILTNVVDNPSLCEFYTCAVLNKGSVKIAVSSNGVSPTLAKRLRDVLDDAIPKNVEETAELLNQIRTKIKGNLEDKITLLNKVTELLIVDNNHTERLGKEEELYDINLN
jgi:siroheme synthase-like protein